MDEEKKSQSNKDCYKGIKFLPPIPTWLFTKYNLTLVEAVYYSFLLTFKYLTWDYEYTGKILRMTKRSVCSMISTLEEKELIFIARLKYGSRIRVVIVPLYDENGLIDSEIVARAVDEGKLSLNKYYSKYHKN